MRYFIDPKPKTTNKTISFSSTKNFLLISFDLSIKIDAYFISTVVPGDHIHAVIVLFHMGKFILFFLDLGDGLVCDERFRRHVVRFSSNYCFGEAKWPLYRNNGWVSISTHSFLSTTGKPKKA